MALIHCDECGQVVSSHAANCPRCGFPVGGMEVIENDLPVRTIQKTSKRIKGVLVITFLCMISGCCGMIAHDTRKTGPDDSSLVWSLMAFVGAVGFVGTKFAQWWEHG